MTENSQSACLMWPATFPGSEKVQQPHTTVLYLGELSNVPLSGTAALLVNTDYLQAPGEVKVTGLEVFGPEDDQVWVARLDDTVIGPLREKIKKQSARYGIMDASSYPDYKPHVTLGSKSGPKPAAPKTVHLGPLEMWWGDEHLRW